jgi:hypothetical protein
MPVPVVDFNDLAVQMLPSAQRLPQWKIFAKALVSPVVTMYQAFSDDMQPGTVYTVYDPATTYAEGYPAVVVYQFKTYISLIAGNIGNRPDESPAAWGLRSDNAIGSAERAKFTIGYLTFTYAINRHFYEYLEGLGIPGWRQPPYPAPYDFGLGGGTFSGIYLTTDALVDTSIVVATIETGSGVVGTSDSSGFYVSTEESFGTETSYKYTIHIPTATFNALGTTDAIRTSVVRQFADKYTATGILYSIVTY